MPRRILVGNIEYNGEILTDEEERLFDSRYNLLTSPFHSLGAVLPLVKPSLVRSRRWDAAILQNLLLPACFQERREHIKATVMIAKERMGGLFRPSGYGSELSFGVTRPHHILRQGVIPSKSWRRSNAWTEGVNYWINPDGNHMSYIDKRCLIIVLGYMELRGATIQQVKLTVDYVEDNPVTMLPHPITLSPTRVMMPLSAVEGTVYVSKIGYSSLMPVAITVGTNKYLRSFYVEEVQ